MKFGGMEIIIIVAIVLLLFGTTLIPKLFKKGKESVRTLQDEIDQAGKEFKREEEAEEAEDAEETAEEE